MSGTSFVHNLYENENLRLITEFSCKDLRIQRLKMMILASLLSLLLSAFVVHAQDQTIVDIAVGSTPGQFNTLVAAVKAAIEFALDNQ